MADFKAGYGKLKAKLTKVDTESLRLWSKARDAVKGWPLWTPVIVMAAVAGHCV